LRDAAVQKLAIDLREGMYNSKDTSQLLRGFASILKRTIQYKNVQVFLTSAALLQTLCQEVLERSQLRRAEVQNALEPLLPLLAERLGDANQRVDKTAKDAHLDFARSPNAGAPFTAQHLLKPPKKKTVHARVYTSRLQLLAAFVAEFGVQPDSKDGISLEGTMKVAMECFSNPTADVRESAVKLVGACYAKVGMGRVEQYLANLREKQREVFAAEFERVSGSANSAPTSTRASTGRPSTSRSGTRDDADGAYGEPFPPQVPPPRHSGVKEANVRMSGMSEGNFPCNVDPEVEGEIDEYTCEFCRRHDPSFTPDALDVHYWRDCPMLMQCQFCEQVIEISTFSEHIQGECENGVSARSVFRSLPRHQCPLCMAKLSGCEDRDWREHLLARGCPRNPRKRHPGQ